LYEKPFHSGEHAGLNCNDLKVAIIKLSEPLVLGDETLQELESHLRVRKLSKGEHVLHAGDLADALYFVRSGVLRYYYLSGGVEHTGQFFEAGNFFGDVFALTTGQPALQNIDAVVDAEVLAMPLRILEDLFLVDHALERWGRRTVENAMAGSQRRTASLLQLDPSTRYENFLKARPSIAKIVPQYIIASYLGITPEALSRIRGKRAQKAVRL
jgi:CRP-like cAMP-binding protein